ncbi:MAG TPA: DUF1990 domain-containing protein [Gemmataceae bacterium]|jgi:uncharacterized protein (UPF0548 family)|nr:DUF1990 domain-containing protein [Gemmataceae bacterium]
MILFRRPAQPTILDFLKSQARLDFTYRGVGATAEVPPPGYVLDHKRVELGMGEHVFAAARAALESWGHFQLGWVHAWPRDTLIQPGEVVAVIAHVMGIWWLNAARIVHVVDEVGPMRRFGFAYGTLPGHVESGEERFSIEWDQARDTVCYDILAFSKPRHILAKLGYPMVRRLQRRFARDSAAAMLREVQQANDQQRA